MTPTILHYVVLGCCVLLALFLFAMAYYVAGYVTYPDDKGAPASDRYITSALSIIFVMIAVGGGYFLGAWISDLYARAVDDPGCAQPYTGITVWIPDGGQRSFCADLAKHGVTVDTLEHE